MDLMYVVAFKAWLLGALGFSKVPTAHTQAPAVPVCGWWAKGNADGVLGTHKCVLCLCHACPDGHWAPTKLFSHAHDNLKINC